MNSAVLVTTGHIVGLANELKATFVRSNNDNAMNLTKTTTADLVADAKFYMNELVYLVPTSERESEQASRFAGDLASVAYELGERGYRQSFIDLCMSRIETADSKF